MNCVRCEGALSHESYEGVEIDRCGKCHGAWLDMNELGKIVSTKEKKFTASLIQETLTTACAGIPREEIRSLEHCPKCSSAMKAINYVYNSGIIIDSCPDGHGVWLDGKELDKVQAFKEHGDSETIKHGESWRQLAESVLEDHKEAKNKARMEKELPLRYVINSTLRKLLGL